MGTRHEVPRCVLSHYRNHVMTWYYGQHYGHRSFAAGGNYRPSKYYACCSSVITVARIAWSASWKFWCSRVYCSSLERDELAFVFEIFTINWYSRIYWCRTIFSPIVRSVRFQGRHKFPSSSILYSYCTTVLCCWMYVWKHFSQVFLLFPFCLIKQSDLLFVRVLFE